MATRKVKHNGTDYVIEAEQLPNGKFICRIDPDWAPLYAEPRFLPKDLRGDFTRLTGIPVLTDQRPPRYSILNDPDTGVRLPGEENQAEGRTRHRHRLDCRSDCGRRVLAVL